MGLREYFRKRKFTRTPEPKGKVKSMRGKLRFVVQEHHATALHYDFRLEMEGVLKSWAVPKGPSMNPHDHHLAIQTEDHPFEYRKFEGVIPEGNYGAGNVIIWDEGWYEPRADDGDEKSLLRDLRKGHVTFIMHGEKLKGEFALIRMPHATEDNAWLLIKKGDQYASEKDITKQDESVKTHRKVDDLGAHGKLPDLSEFPKISKPWSVNPMLCTLIDEPFSGEDWLFEVKWDGYRAIATKHNGEIELYSRNHNSFLDKYPPVVEAVRELKHDVILDGEVVVVDKNGRAHFEWLQMWHTAPQGILQYHVFDILWLDGWDVRGMPLRSRKALLKAILPKSTTLQFSDDIEAKGEKLFAEMQRRGMEGMVAKKADSPYREEIRGRDWLKIKTHLRQEVVIGGYTEPRGSRKYLGALLVGVYENGEFKYVGHSGGGIPDEQRKTLQEKLNKLERKSSPFSTEPKPNAPVHWVRPELVCEMEFSEWTSEGSMRHPEFKGLRSDKEPKDVHKEKAKDTKHLKKEGVLSSGPPHSVLAKAARAMGAAPPDAAPINNRGGAPWASPTFSRSGTPRGQKEGAKGVTGPQSFDKSAETDDRTPVLEGLADDSDKKGRGPVSRSAPSVLAGLRAHGATPPTATPVSHLPFEPTHLDKIFFPKHKYTKGDLFEYYTAVADYILPYLKDRPLSLNRMPNGITGEGFFQKNHEHLPDWITHADIYSESNKEDLHWIVGGDLATLLYIVQLGSIEINPWNSRVGHLDKPDWIVIDLDPEGIGFEKVIEVAKMVHEVCEEWDIPNYPKTSGKTGLHIFIPMGAKYSYDQAKNLAHLIVLEVNKRQPKITSVLRMPDKRKHKIYLDFLQNREGQTLAAPYSVRPTPDASVAMPLKWSEVKSGLKPSDFTIKNAPARLKRHGDLWKPVLGKGLDLEKVLKKIEKTS